MSILDSQLIQNILAKLTNKVRKNKIELSIFPRFIFICGKQIIKEDGSVRSDKELINSDNKRQYIISSFEKSRIQVQNKEFKKALCVVSEKMYSNNEIVDTLTFEELLAELSDEIIIIVESAGTICELGAFTVKKEYLEKMLVINDEQHIDDKSFINEGPIKKLINYKEEKLIWTSYDYEKFKKNFLINNYIKEVLDSNVTIKPNKCNKVEIKSLIYELFNIIEIFTPLTNTELLHIYKNVKKISSFEIKNRDKHKINSISKVIGIMERMKLIYINNKYIIPNNEYTCFNALFNITREEFNEVKNEYLSIIYSDYIYRVQESDNNDITINE